MQARHLLSCAAIALAFCATGAFAADGCRTIVNGIQKCDVPTGREATREAVVAELRSHTAPSVDGCRTIVNGIQKCDLPAAYAPRNTAIAAAH